MTDFNEPMLELLSSMSPIEGKKLLLLLRQLVAPSAYSFVEEQLLALDGVEVDTDWVAAIRSDPGIKDTRRKLARWVRDVNDRTAK